MGEVYSVRAFRRMDAKWEEYKEAFCEYCTTNIFSEEEEDGDNVGSSRGDGQNQE